MTEGRDRETPAGPAAGREARTIAAVAVMALTIVAGAGVVLLMPRPKSSSPLELARPAPVAVSTLPAWLAPRPASPPAPAAETPAAPAPPLRERRLETAQVARTHAVKTRAVIARAPERPATAQPSECRQPASAADRLVCARPELAAQERALRRAYDRALAAGADRLAVDRDQARWRGQRDKATDAAVLSRLYARRIAELDSTARAAGHRRIYG